jgi:activating signal cointegrator 1
LIFSYIQKIKSDDELKSYFESLLNFSDEKHCVFYNALKQKLFPSKHVSVMTSSKTNSPDENQKQEKTGAKRKTKYYNMYGKDGQINDVVMLKGRNRCDCQASKHKLINNCLKCGRIVCEQEGSGPCMHCGNLVCTEEEHRQINSQTKKGDNLKKSLMGSSKDLKDALAFRDRLLEYDRQSERRTTVIDDESDYFKANSVWLTDEERKKLKDLEDQLKSKKHASRLDKKVTIDFAGRQVVEEESFSKEIEERILRQIMDATSGSNHMYSNINPEMAGQAPIFDESIQSNFPKLKKNKNGFDGIYNRVQDKEFQEMSDLKCCMSMHQPWASLLVAGIKKHEGRTWYTNHRGRLWIASSAKPVDQEEIKQLEQFYRLHYQNENFNFPSQYPSGNFN